jgi:GNAT superfamily N-acetyltransferase
MMAREGGSEPPAKRVRFGGGESADGEYGDTSPESVAPSPLNSPPTSLDASDVIELRFVSQASDVHPDGARGSHAEELTARPTFTHQIFPGGVVHGAVSAKAALYYTCGSLTNWLDVDVVPRDNVDQADGEPVTRVYDTLSKFMHAGRVESRVEFETAAALDTSFAHPFKSEAVLAYKRGERQFSVFKSQLASSADVVDYHKRIQLLMFMHIDGANFIDSADMRWELFVVLEHINGAPRFLVGYATVYPFSAIRPGCSLNEGFAERIRVSQVFVLPHYQRGGHGSTLLTAVYNDASERSAIEVTVEDPSEGFRMLRDATDLPRAYKAGILDPEVRYVDDNDAIVAAIGRMRKELLVTKTQARRCLEIHELTFVDRDDETIYKQYRLWVKRRLHDEFVEVLDAFSGDERKAKLGEIYEDYETEYLQVVDRLGRKRTTS